MTYRLTRVCVCQGYGDCLFTRVTHFVGKTFPSLLYITVNYSNGTYMILHSSGTMLDAVFAEVQQVFHQSMEFPLHCLCYKLLYVYFIDIYNIIYKYNMF